MEEERNYTVYMHLNKENGKTYVGITSKKPEKRWANGLGYSPSYFRSAINKYGWDSFEHIILFENKTKEEAEQLEILFIRVLLSNNHTYGYNLSNGGNSKGKHSKETKLKISKIRKERINRSNHPSSKKVICDNKIFDCLKDCAEYYNVVYGTMNDWLLCKNPMSQKFIDLRLRYLDDNDFIPKKEANTTGKNNANSKKIICNGIIYDCVNDLADFYGINPSNISSWIRGKKSIPEKYNIEELRYLDDISGISLIHTTEKKTTHIGRKVICDNKVFQSIKECSDYFNINQNTMTNWLCGHSNMPKEFLELNLRYLNDNTTTYEIQKGITGKQIICDNKTFNSIRECSDYYNENYNAFYSWITNARPMPQKYIDLGLRFIGDDKTTYVPQNKPTKRKTICNNKIFDSVVECADFYNVNSETMRCWLSGKRSMPQNFKDLGLEYYIEN